MEPDDTPLFKDMDPIATALRQGLEVPQDTFITDGFPLLLTRLGFVPASPGAREPVADLPTHA